LEQSSTKNLPRGLTNALVPLLLLLPAILLELGCGGASAPSSSQTSGIANRAFLTNNVTSAPGVYIVNASSDLRGTVAPIAAGNTPTLMVVTPNRSQTLVFSGNGLPSSDNQFTIINNTSETAAGHLTLPGMTYSFVVSPDSNTAFVAVPTAPVQNQPPGVVLAVSLTSGSILGQVNVPSARYLAIDNGGNRLLAFSSGTDAVADTVAVITPSNIGIGNAVTFVGGVGTFDHPVQAFFSSDDTSAYIVSCGAECGGVQASVQQFDLNTNQLVASIPSCIPVAGTDPIQCSNPAAGSYAIVDNSIMYLAGTPPFVGGNPQQACTGQTTAATSCGLLNIIDLSTLSVVNTAPIVITDGFHSQMAMGPNGQLFIGATSCTEIIPPLPPATGETRGCLSIYNTLTSAVGGNLPGGVVIPPENGDVTGIQPIAKRGSGLPQQVVYVVQGQGVAETVNQGGALSIYDTTIDALEYNPNDTNNPGQIFGLVGNFVQVKTVDF
jgi:hypothetical protein